MRVEAKQGKARQVLEATRGNARQMFGMRCSKARVGGEGGNAGARGEDRQGKGSRRVVKMQGMASARR
jgi:hypothetical protein